MELKRYKTAIDWTDTPFQGDHPYPVLVPDLDGEIVLYVDAMALITDLGARLEKALKPWPPEDLRI